ncbi:MAG: TonB-dependent receptor [Halioglobus sp.]
MNTAYKSGNKMAFVYKVSLLASSVAFASAALAQPVLEEVFVTAQKRVQSLQDVPASVSAISGESINDFVGSAENIRALAGRVPSLQIESSNGRQSPRFYIRGLGNTDFDVNGSQPVSMILDDIALENSVLKSLPLFDVARVEVLKGPQGTLFGRNTPAGVVKIDSVRPSHETEGYISGGYGSRETANVELAIGGELTDTIASRLSLKYVDRGAWIDNSVTGDEFGGFDEFAYRLQFLFEPSENLTALVKFHGFDQDGDHPQIFYANALEQGKEGLRSGFDEEEVTQDSPAGFEMEHFGTSANIEYQFGGLTLTSITGYDTVDSFSRADVDGGLVTFSFDEFGDLGRNAFGVVASGDGLDDHYQFSQEFRLSGETDKMFYQVGLFYFDEDITIRSTDFMASIAPDFSAPELDRTTFVEQQTKSIAVFGQVEYRVTDDLAVTGGLRYTDDDKDLEVVPGPNSTAFSASIDTQDDYISWDLAVNYDLNNDWSIYGRVGEASRGPVTIGRFGFTSQADTETLTSVEIGFKSVLLDGAARWNAAIYSFEIEDQQLTATGGFGNFNTLLNADKTQGAGFETDFEWLITENFRFMSNLSYNDTEIDDKNLTTSACTSTPLCTIKNPIASVDNPSDFGPFDTVFVDGNPLPRSPEWLFNVALSYTVPLSSGASMYFNTDWNYRGESNIFLYESVEHVAEERWLGGVRFGYKTPGEKLDLAVVGRNITDELTVDGALDFLNLSAFINEPAFWGVEARYSF